MFLEMYCGLHNCPHKYIFGIHTYQDDFQGSHPIKVQNFRCYKSTYCQTIWDARNIIRFFTNWIFGLWILKYHKRCSDYCTLSSYDLHNPWSFQSHLEQINIFNMFVTFKSKNLSIITIDNEMNFICIFNRILIQLPSSKLIS